jgi:hypothetical protein
MTMTTTMIEFREVDSDELTSVGGGSGEDDPVGRCGVGLVYEFGRLPRSLGT